MLKSGALQERLIGQKISRCAARGERRAFAAAGGADVAGVMERASG